MIDFWNAGEHAVNMRNAGIRIKRDSAIMVFFIKRFVLSARLAVIPYRFRQ
jgi:hypothetical protein